MLNTKIFLKLVDTPTSKRNILYLYVWHTYTLIEYNTLILII